MQLIQMTNLIDQPVYLLFWPADQLIPIISFVLLGIILDKFWMTSFLGLLLNYIYLKYSASKAPGFVMHYLYKLGLIYFRSASIPNPFIKYYH